MKDIKELLEAKVQRDDPHADYSNAPSLFVFLQIIIKIMDSENITTNILSDCILGYSKIYKIYKEDIDVIIDRCTYKRKPTDIKKEWNDDVSKGVIKRNKGSINKLADLLLANKDSFLNSNRMYK